jgi:hypothetical protein
VIKEIAADENVSLDTDLLAKLFTSSTWTIKNSVLLNLAINGMINITDNRVATISTEEDTVNTVDKDLVTNQTIDKELEVQALENVEDE